MIFFMILDFLLFHFVMFICISSQFNLFHYLFGLVIKTTINISISLYQYHEAKKLLLHYIRRHRQT